MISRHYVFLYASTIELTSLLLGGRAMLPTLVPLQASHDILHLVGDYCSPDISQSCPKVVLSVQVMEFQRWKRP